MIFVQIEGQVHQSLIEEQRSHAAVEVGRYAANLSITINERFALLNGLYAFAESHIAELDGSPSSELENFTLGLLASHSGIRNFLVAPGGVSTYEYPLKGNEGMLGTNMLQDPRPQVFADIHRALETREITISGPYELKQGGLGLVARRAIYQDDEFWGLVSMALDLPPILQEAGLTAADSEYRVALRDAAGKVFFGEPDLFESDPITLEIVLPEWSWELAAVPMGGWEHSIAPMRNTYHVLGLIVGALLLAVIYLLAAQRQRLIEQVDEKTRALNQTAAALQQELEVRIGAEAALRASRQRYQLLFECGSDAKLVYPLEADGRPGNFSEVNDTACRRLGYAREELLQRSVLDIIDPDLLPKIPDYVSALMRQGNVLVESFHQAKDGKLIPVEVSSQLFWIDDTPMIFSIARDISARKAIEAALRESERRFREILDKVRLLGLCFDRSGTITYVNDFLLEVTGRKAVEVIGQNWGDRFLLDGAAFRQRVAELMESEVIPTYLENEILTAEGRRRLIAWNNIALRDTGGALIGLACLGEDITELRKTISALQESEKRFRLLADNARDLIYRYTFIPEPGFEFVSQSALEVTGYTPEEHYADPQLGIKIVHPDDREKLAAYQNSDAPDNAPILLRWLKKDGTLIWTEQHNRLLFDENGKLVALEGIARDITERMRALETLRRYQTLSEQTSDIILFVRIDGRIIEANQAALQAYGYSMEELLELRIHDLRAHSPDEMVREQIQEADLRGIRFETLHRRKDGSAFPVEVSSVGTTINNERVLLSLVRDITERKQAEAEILRLNAGLENRVSERTAELSAANQELEAFAYSVAHDLRAPLRGIAGFSETLLENYAGRLDADGQRYLARVYDSSQKMGQIIDDLLRLSQVGRDELILEPIDITGKATSIVCDLRDNQPGRAVDVVIAPNMRAVADRRLVSIALEQLLENAWKFTRETGNARIEVGCLEPSDHPELDAILSSRKDGAGVKPCHVFYVRDNGAGFDMAYRAKLFQPFQRLHHLAQYPGDGVGLAIVQRVIQRHGGRIWAEGEVGSGACFYFVLDAA